MFISSLTENVIIAYILTFTLVLTLWILDVFAQNLGGAIASVFSYLSLFQNYQDLIEGLLSSKSLILFASYIFLGVFLTAQSIEALRFQRS
jgi:ABC-2 type transport system permease protein